MGARVSRHFVCALCGLEYHASNTEAEANQELLATGKSTDGQSLHSVCDSCYQRCREQGLVP